MTEFTSIYNFNGVTILYYFITNIHELVYKLNLYINNNTTATNGIIYIITNPYKENINFDFIQNKNIILLKTDIDFDFFFKLHALRHDYFYKNNIKNTENLLNAFNKISVSWDNYPNMSCYNRREMFINNLHNDLNNYKKTIAEINESDVIGSIEQNTPIDQLECYNTLLEDINNFLSENIESFSNGDIQFKEYVTMYNFSRQHIITVKSVPNNIVLENVYYINKQWFDKDKTPLQMEDFYQDFEYTYWEYYAAHNGWDASIKDISNIPVYQEIEEEVMFLDYVYWFYNFGEFWDVIKRLLLSKTKNLPLFHLTRNRITNIQYYFDKLQFIYPTTYQKQERRCNKLFYFHKVHISLPTNIGCRGSIPKDFAYQFNKILNPCQISETSYNIYLARGAYGRSIQNEREIVDVLTTKYNFIVLNGTESLEDTMRYFTNARIILGAHGSLMKNMIYCKKNPVLIELFPSSRHDCFYGNARELGFLPFFILVDCNKNEEIILNDQQMDELYEMLDNLI
jgi:hypothetical protein